MAPATLKEWTLPMSVQLAVWLLTETAKTGVFTFSVDQVIRSKERSIKCCSKEGLLFWIVSPHVGHRQSWMHVWRTYKSFPSLC
jgi:hypothetical protein